MKKIFYAIIALFSMSFLAIENTEAQPAAWNYSFVNGVSNAYYPGVVSWPGIIPLNPTSGNTFYGLFSGTNVTSGTELTGIGAYALNLNTTGSVNTCVGLKACWVNTTGSFITALGAGAAENTTIGTNIVAIGDHALNLLNGDGFDTAVGHNACLNTVTGKFDICIGHSSGIGLGTGTENIAIGTTTFGASTNVSTSIAIGDNALASVTTSPGPLMGIGVSACGNITTGYYDICIGYGAGLTQSDGTTPCAANVSGIFIGRSVECGAGSSNEVVIGDAAVGNGTNSVTLGNSSMTALYTWGVIHNGAAVGVSCSGTPTSSFASVNGIVTHC